MQNNLWVHYQLELHSKLDVNLGCQHRHNEQNGQFFTNSQVLRCLPMWIVSMLISPPTPQWPWMTEQLRDAKLRSTAWKTKWWLGRMLVHRPDSRIFRNSTRQQLHSGDTIAKIQREVRGADTHLASQHSGGGSKGSGPQGQLKFKTSLYLKTCAYVHTHYI